MKQYQSLGLVAVMAVVAGLTGVTALGDFSFVENDASSMNTNVPIMGHVIITVTDNEGNIKNYMQTDNIITEDGKMCVGELLFDPGTNGCPDSATVFDDIVLSSASFPDTAATAGLTNSGFTPQLVGSLAEFSSTAVTEAVAASGSTTGARIDLAHTFSYTGGSSQTVTSAALMNTANSVFAIKDFPSAVSLNNGDDLTVTWQITLG